MAASEITRQPGFAHAVLVLGGFMIGTTEFATMSFLPAFTSDLAVDAPTGGYVVSAYALGVVLGAPMLAVVGARLERRLFLILLLIWFGVGNCLSATASSFGASVALRFLTAIPHGAYFGIAVLVASGMVTEAKRGAAIGRVLLGLTLATTIGAPVATVISQWLSWRWGFGVLGLLSFVAAALILFVIPVQARIAGASASQELGALRRGQVWLSLGIGAVGFGGLFAVYTYLTSTLELVTKASASAIPFVLAVFGVGLTCGNLAAPHLTRRGPMPAIGILLAWSALALALYPLTVDHLWSIGIAVFAIGWGGGLGTLLQMRLMDVAGDAQGLAASLNHAAFNTANALGPWLGGLAIAAGYGWASTGWVGCGLALGGFVFWMLALAHDSRAVKRGQLIGDTRGERAANDLRQPASDARPRA
ncbi:MFS transporter [Rhizobium sp. 60-20]|jgi:DHA1 family inner membrane transport protein|nr:MULTISPECIES: MFS transporter [unclassified Rhizobium]OJY74063.1 MAG: MFS transporter [Rhizobium sp. 60-20]RKD61516.1 DHA1 family inner membrane transport protein [Rhizobium sp. WW_1]